MCRRALERLCAEQNAKGRDLNAKIDALRDAGTIDGRLWDWAHGLRTAGNAALHGEDEVSREDSGDLLKFTEALIDYVFVVGRRCEEFTARQEARQAKAKKAAAKKTAVKKTAAKAAKQP